MDYSSPWHDDFVANKEEIRANLHILHPSMQTVLQMCQGTLGDMLLVDCSTFRWAFIFFFYSLDNTLHVLFYVWWIIYSYVHTFLQKTRTNGIWALEKQCYSRMWEMWRKTNHRVSRELKIVRYKYPYDLAGKMKMSRIILYFQRMLIA